jgi:hypothetical protein
MNCAVCVVTTIDQPPSLAANARSISFWRSLCPWLTITDFPFRGSADWYHAEESQGLAAGEQMRVEGYFLGPQLVPAQDTGSIARGVRAVVDSGFPATFALVYDEVWSMLSRLGSLMVPVLGRDFCMTRDVWVYYIRGGAEPTDGVTESAGWAPHRDGGEHVKTLRSDGSPLLMGVWIPLEDVSIDQACMYLLPNNRDPNFPQQLRNTTIEIDALRHIRALPARAGTVMGWNEYTLHWGSRPPPSERRPRLSIAARFQSRELAPFDGNYLSQTRSFGFHERLDSIAAVIRRYESRAPCPSGLTGFVESQLKLNLAVDAVLERKQR